MINLKYRFAEFRIKIFTRLKELVGKQDDRYKSFSEESNTSRKNKNEEYFKTLPIRASESYDTLLERNNLSEIALEQTEGNFATEKTASQRRRDVDHLPRNSLRTNSSANQKKLSNNSSSKSKNL